MLEQEEITDRIIGAAREVEAVHLAFGRSYLRAVGRRNGLLLNFNAPTLEIKRVIAPHCVPNFLPSLDILAETQDTKSSDGAPG